MPELTVSIDTSKAVTPLATLDKKVEGTIKVVSRLNKEILTLETTFGRLRSVFGGQSVFKSQSTDARNLARNINGIRRSAEGMNRAVRASQSVMRTQARQFRSSAAAARFLRRNLVGLSAGFGIAVAIRSAVRALAEFDQQMAVVASITGLAGKELKELRDVAISFSQSTIFKPTEVAKGLEQLARAGLDAKESLQALPAILDFSTANLISTDQAVKTVISAITQFGLSMDEATKVTDVFTKTALSSVTNVEELAQSFKFVGPVAAAFGNTIEQTSAALGILANAGLRQSLSGAGLRQVLIDLATPTEKARIAIDKLGLTVEELNPSFRSFEDILETLSGAMDRVGGEQEFLNIALGIFEARSAAAALASVRFNKEMAQLNVELGNADGTTRKTADAVKNNLLGSYKLLTASLEALTTKTADVSAEGLTFLGVLNNLILAAAVLVRELSGVEAGMQDVSGAAKDTALLLKLVFAPSTTLISKAREPFLDLAESIFITKREAREFEQALKAEREALLRTASATGELADKTGQVDLETLIAGAKTVESATGALSEEVRQLVREYDLQQSGLDALNVSGKITAESMDDLSESFVQQKEKVQELRNQIVGLVDLNERISGGESEIARFGDTIRDLEIESSLFDVSPDLRASQRALRSFLFAGSEMELLTEEFNKLSEEIRELEKLEQIGDDIGSAFAGAARDIVVAGDSIEEVVENLGRQLAGIAFDEFIGDPIRESFRRLLVGFGPDRREAPQRQDVDELRATREIAVDQARGGLAEPDLPIVTSLDKTTEALGSLERAIISFEQQYGTIQERVGIVPAEPPAEPPPGPVRAIDLGVPPPAEVFEPPRPRTVDDLLRDNDLFNSTRGGDVQLENAAEQLLRIQPPPEQPTGPAGQAGPIPGFPSTQPIADAISAATVSATGGFAPSANDSDTPLFFDGAAVAEETVLRFEKALDEVDFASIFESGLGGADVVNQIPWEPLVSSVDAAGAGADTFANRIGSAADSSSIAMSDSTAAVIASTSVQSQVPSAVEAVIGSLVRLSTALDQLASKISALSDQPSQPELPRRPDQQEREREVGFDPRSAASTQVFQGVSASAFGQERDAGAIPDYLVDAIRGESREGAISALNALGPSGGLEGIDVEGVLKAADLKESRPPLADLFTSGDIGLPGPDRELRAGSKELVESFAGLAATTEKVLPGIEGIGGLGLSGVAPRPPLASMFEAEASAGGFSRGAGPPFTAESAVGMFAGPGFDRGATPGFNVMTDNPLEPVVAGPGVDIGGALAGIAGGVVLLAPLLTSMLGVDQEVAQVVGLIATGITAMIILLEIIAAFSPIPGFQHGDVFRGAQVGVIGEAGPEAVLPLGRGPGGDLGVQVFNPGGVRAPSSPAGGENEPTRQVNIFNNTIRTPDASSFRKSRRQVNRDQARGIRGIR